MIDVLHLFPTLNSSLIDLLKGLSREQWNSATICKNWTVKDIAAHLLDTALRRVSAGRDNYFSEAPEIKSYEDLLDFLNRLNGEWVKAYRRVSPEIIVNQMSAAQDQFLAHLQQLDPFSQALFPVSWAGEEESKAWFDIAREYTERWHHQQQIRHAIGASGITTPDFYHPFLEICMLALPFHYRLVNAALGTVLTVHVVGEAGGTWSIIRNETEWKFAGPEANSENLVFIDQNIAWMLFSKGIDIIECGQYWQVKGDYGLGYHALKMTAFMV